MTSAYVCCLIVLLVTRCESTGPSVVVVGAGAAGIAAATRLLKNGIENVTVLEAEDRIGGRVYSVKLGESYVDLGTEWCYGEKSNIVFEMVYSLDVLNPGDVISPSLYHTKLKLVDDSFSDKLFGIFLELFGENRDGANTTLGEYLGERYRDVVGQVWADDEEKLHLAYESADLFEKMVLWSMGAFCWFSLSAETDYEECEGNQRLEWNSHGYKTILDVLMQKCPNPENSLSFEILLNKEVSQIMWNATVDGQEKMVVTCVDQSEYVADDVILTVSLGVLKNQHEVLIVPGLTEEKTRAVEQLGMDGIFKAMLLFDRPWWNSSFSGYFFVWSADDLQHTFSESPVKCRVVETYFPSEIERCPDETLIDGFMYLMTRFEVCNDPLVTASGKLGLMFAGEVTHPTKFSTVHGAIRTGFREADRLLKAYKENVV